MRLRRIEVQISYVKNIVYYAVFVVFFELVMFNLCNVSVNLTTTSDTISWIVT